MSTDSFTFSDSSIATSDINTDSLFENSISLDSEQTGGDATIDTHNLNGHTENATVNTDDFDGYSDDFTIDTYDLESGSKDKTNIGLDSVTINTEDIHDNIDSMSFSDSSLEDSDDASTYTELTIGGGDHEDEDEDEDEDYSGKLSSFNLETFKRSLQRGGGSIWIQEYNALKNGSSIRSR
jgi:hypothetical protein